jgi:hypothetical protein
VLSVRAHRHRAEAASIAALALKAVSTLDEARARFYSELVLDWLPAAARAILEASMDIKTEFISDWSREKIAQGQAQGRAEGRADALLRVLRARGIVRSTRPPCNASARARISRCSTRGSNAQRSHERPTRCSADRKGHPPLGLSYPPAGVSTGSDPA